MKLLSQKEKFCAAYSMNTEMICQSCTLIYHKDIYMDIKKKLEEIECTNNLLVAEMQVI